MPVQQIRQARHTGSRKTHAIPFDKIGLVLEKLEEEANLSRKERMRIIHERAGGFSLERSAYLRRSQVKMSTGTWRILLAIAFPLYTGFRRSDIVTLRWDHIVYFDVDQSVTVRPSVEIREQKTSKKRKRKREVPLGKEIAYYILKAYMEMRPREMREYVFKPRVQSSRPHLSVRGYNKIIEEAFARFEVFDRGHPVAPHALRKSYCQYIFKEMGGNFEALLKLNKILAHSTVEMTIRYLEIDIEESKAVHYAINFRGKSARPGERL